MTVINVELHWPPSLNDTYSGRKGGGGLYMKKHAREWKDRNAWLIRSQLPHGHKPLAGPLACCMALTPPDRRQADIDNRLKLTFDCLELARALENDSQIKRLEIDWLEPKKPGFVRLSLQSLER